MGETLCKYVLQRWQIEKIDELIKNDDECYCEKMIKISVHSYIHIGTLEKNSCTTQREEELFSFSFHGRNPFRALQYHWRLKTRKRYYSLCVVLYHYCYCYCPALYCIVLYDTIINKWKLRVFYLRQLDHRTLHLSLLHSIVCCISFYFSLLFSSLSHCLLSRLQREHLKLTLKLGLKLKLKIQKDISQPYWTTLKLDFFLPLYRVSSWRFLFRF